MQFNQLLLTLETQKHCRYRPRFFDQFGLQTTNASSGNKYFFTKKNHCLTYQNYEQSQQKLGTFCGNKVLKKSNLKKIMNRFGISILIKYSPHNFFGKIGPIVHQTMKNDFETQSFEIFDKVVHNLVKKSLFPIKALVV